MDRKSAVIQQLAKDLEESEEQNRMATRAHQSNLGKLNEVNFQNVLLYFIKIFRQKFSSKKFRFNNHSWMIWKNDFKRSLKRIKKLLTQTQQHLLKRQNSQMKILIRSIVRLNRPILIYQEKSKKIFRNFEQIFIHILSPVFGAHEMIWTNVKVVERWVKKSDPWRKAFASYSVRGCSWKSLETISSSTKTI